ncbi:MAG: phosphoribosylformylglycinamidine cyclo-ligase [Chloroflexota bacterium]
MAARREKATYRAAGVDTDTADRLVKTIARAARTTFGPEVLGDVGFFGGLFELQGYQQPVLVSSADGVGTKLKIACAQGKHEGIGVDLANHCVNDVFTCGAKPLFFLDYVAMATLAPATIESIVRGMTRALSDVGCALIGGETAEMPGLYPQGEYDFVGFIVGVVEKSHILNGSSIRAGDIIIGLPSSGLHTNGYSLARKVLNTDDDPSVLEVFYPELGRTLGDALLEPHRCYYNTLKPFLASVKGMAHITGGGIPGNLPRILPPSLAARLNKDAWHVPPLFSLIQERGSVDEEEMYRAFNMGIGMMVICPPDSATELCNALPDARAIGEIVERKSEGQTVIM